MKLILTTTYGNVNGEWLDWWVKNNGPIYGINTKSEKPIFPHQITTQDPTSKVWGNTEIRLVEEEDLCEIDKTRYEKGDKL